MSVAHQIKLPQSVQEIADVIGRESALKLIGSAKGAGRRSWRVNIYVPARLSPDHQLVRILGWHSAYRLCRYFGGEILQPSSCSFIERAFRNQSIMTMNDAGRTTSEISHDLGISCRTVRHVIASAKAPVAKPAVNDNHTR